MEGEAEPYKQKIAGRLLKMTIIFAIIGSVIIAVSMYFTALSYFELSLLIFGCGAVTLIIQWRIFYSRKPKQRPPVGIFLLYNFAGTGFLLAGIFLLFNWLGAERKEIIEQYRIVGIDMDYTYAPCCNAVLLLENNAYANEPSVRMMPYHIARKNKQLPVFRIIKRKGLLGIPILKAKEMAIEEKLQEQAKEEIVAEE